MNSLIKNYWLFYSLFCGSILLAAPAAIAEKIKPLSNPQTISEKAVLNDLTRQNNSDISKFTISEELALYNSVFSGVVTPSQKQLTFIVPTVATDESLVNLNSSSLQIAQVPLRRATIRTVMKHPQSHLVTQSLNLLNQRFLNSGTFCFNPIFISHLAFMVMELLKGLMQTLQLMLVQSFLLFKKPSILG